MGPSACTRAVLLLVAVAALVWAPSAAWAAGPTLGESWVTDVTASSANLHAEVDPQGSPAFYHFEYLTETAFLAAGGSFAGAASVPATGEAFLGAGTAPVAALQHVSGLTPATSYRYRIVAANGEGSRHGPAHALRTEEVTPTFSLLDARAWEMVSPPDKNGGAVAAPGELRGGGDLQAAAGGGAATFSSAASFAAGGGAPWASQYLSTRTASGWVTQNITLPTLAGAFGTEPEGVPYRLFSPSLGRAAVLNPSRCPEAEGCPRSLVLRDTGSGLLASSSAAPGLRLAGAGAGLAYVVLHTEAGLTEWGGGASTTISTEPGASLAAQSGAISADGARVYWVSEAGVLNLWEAGRDKPVDESGQAEFQAASEDGSVAFYLREGRFYRYDAAAATAIDLTPAGGVSGVLGISTSGSVVYYQDAAGLERWDEGATAQVAAAPEAAAATDYPPATGTARVTPDGSALAFLSEQSEALSGYDNTDQNTGEPDSQVYLYRAWVGLSCLSCDPSGERPRGPATIPGADPNGSLRAYKPRALSADGRRLFFTTADALTPLDGNHADDVYEWEAGGEGTCAQAAGCLGLISSGRAPGGAAFADASASGADAFFLTEASLSSQDLGAVDLYDARENGGFPEPPSEPECIGDACQPIPAEPEDPSPNTLLANPGNPSPLNPGKPHCAKGKKPAKIRGHYRCVVKRRPHHHHRPRHRRGRR